MIEFKEKLDADLNKQNIASRHLLDKFNLIEENDRNSPQYQDPLYFPFYYYLAKRISPESVCQIGVDLGFTLCCFLQGSTSVKKILGFQFDNDNFYSFRIANSNIKKINKKINVDFYLGQLLDPEFQNKFNYKWDLIFINQKLKGELIKETFEFVWSNLKSEGYMIVDFINYDKSIKNHLLNFSKVQNRDTVEFSTRYGIGIIKK
jgi:hypothetical protein